MAPGIGSFPEDYDKKNKEDIAARKRERDELQRQADTGEIPNSRDVQMREAVKRLQSRAFALELGIKLYQNTPAPGDGFLLTVRGIHEFLNETD